MTALLAITISAFLVNLFVWSFVAGQSRLTPLSRAFLIALAWATLWIATDIAHFLPLTLDHGLMLYRFQCLFWMPIGFLFLRFIYRLLGREDDAPYYIAGAASSIALAVALSTDLAIAGLTATSFGYVERAGPLFGWLAAIPAGSSLFGLVLVGRALFKTHSQVDHKSYGIIVTGGLITWTIAIASNLVLPVYLHVTELPRIAAPAMAIFCVFIYRAIYRYQFLSMSVEQVANELFEGAREAVALLDEKGLIRRVNPAALILLDRSEEELRGTSLAALLKLGSLQNSAGSLILTYKRDSDTRVLDLSTSSIVRSGTNVGRFVLMRDVTTRTRFEDGLRATRDQLEQEVERRTEQLRQAQKMEAIGTLAAGIAHDFNNLLGAILGFATAAREDLPAQSPLRDDLDEVLQATRKAKDIVQQILTFSHNKPQQYRLIPGRAVLDETASLIKISLPGDIHLIKQVDNESGHLLGDPSQLNQVLMNLATNAVHAMSKGGGTLTLRLEQLEVDQAFAASHPPLTEGPTMRFTVQDTGSGMDEATLRRSFEPFFTTKPPGLGTGLGLATVLAIIQSHGGAATVTSALGAGSTFEVYLPLYHESDSEAPEEITRAPSGTERILLVDDEAQLIRVGQRLLEPLGYSVVPMTSSVEAWMALRQDPTAYDLVITDQTMPKLTGVQLAAEILKIRPDIPIILISGYTDAVNPADIDRLGIQAFLPKPVSKRDLARTVRELLDQARLAKYRALSG